MEAIASKSFPANFNERVLTILKAMSMTGLKKTKLFGSASIRSQIYAGDYDAYENVSVASSSDVPEMLRDVVKRLRVLPDVYIADIKCGEVDDWNPFMKTARIEDKKILDFNIVDSKKRIDRALASRGISAAEAKEADKMISKINTPFEFLEARKSLRYHVIRWTPKEILEGKEEKHGFTLQQAVDMGGVCKVDVVADVTGRFCEFSMIYDIKSKGKRITDAPPDLVRSLHEDIVYYSQANPFKALKRLFALLKATKNARDAALLVPILNSDLGRLYQIVGDLKTLQDLLLRPKCPVAKIREQIDDMKQRMGNIYLLRDFLKKEFRILGAIDSMLRSPMPTLKRKLGVLIDELQTILDKATVGALREAVKKFT